MWFLSARPGFAKQVAAMKGNALQPRPGFNWMAVSWGGPDELRTDKCSYCETLFPKDDAFVPLIVWRDDGWCAEFCDACQRDWWGLRGPR